VERVRAAQPELLEAVVERATKPAQVHSRMSTR
jgi:hypothetical protein